MLGGVRSVAKVGLDSSVAREDLVGLLLGDRGHNNDVLSRLPVDGSGNAVLGSELQRDEHALDFIEITASRSRVSQSKLELAIRSNDEDTANGEGVVSVGVDHAVQITHLGVSVRENGVADLDVLGLFNVLHPAFVVLNVVDGESNDLGVESLEVGLQPGNSSQLGGADGLFHIGIVSKTFLLCNQQEKSQKIANVSLEKKFVQCSP